MPFFEAPDPPPQPQRPPHSPEWLGPPNGVLPGVVATELVIAEGDQHAICVSRLCAYPTGFTFELLTLAPDSGLVPQQGVSRAGRQR